MDFKDFLGFERKKAILPAIVTVLLVFVLLFSAVYSGKLADDARKYGDMQLYGLKYATYNFDNEKYGAMTAEERNEYDSLFTEAMENSRGMTSEEVGKIENGVVLTSFSSYVPEFFLNFFGANFCPFFYGTSSECIVTELDAVLPSELVHLVSCSTILAGETGLMRNAGTFDDFINTERGQNYFEMTEGCRDSENYIFDPEKISGASSYADIPFLHLFGESPKIRLITPVDIIIIFVTVTVITYLLSCIVVWIHRKNKILQGVGRKPYAVIAAFLGFFYIVVLPFAYINDQRIDFFISLALAYLFTTVLWSIYVKKRENKIAEVVYKIKKRK